MVRLGQNYLADTNLLEAIVRDADLDPGDVALEIGAGEGALSDRVARRVAHLHAIELDRRLAGDLEALSSRHPNLSVVWGDAMRIDLRAFEPAPTVVVSNLPYSIATPVLLRTVAELPQVATWTVMVQREIAERLRASPGSRTYGAPSVLVQLACEVELLRKVDRAVFRPRPRVDSALLRLRRASRGGIAVRCRPRARRVRASPQADRRLAPTGRGAVAGGGAPRARRARPRLRGPGRGARARRLRPSRGALGGPVTLRAPAKLNLCLYLGPRRAEGLHEIRSLFCPLTLADRIVVSEADADQVVCPGVEGPNLAQEALTALRARGWGHPPARVEIEKRIPVAAGLGGGSADAAALLRLARDEVEGVGELAADLGADVPSQLDPAFALVGGAGEVVEPLPPPGEFAAVLLPAEEGLSTAEVYAEADRLGLGRDLAGAGCDRRSAARRRRWRRLAARLPGAPGQRPG